MKNEGASIKKHKVAGQNSDMNNKHWHECRACLERIGDQSTYKLFEPWVTPWAMRGAIIAEDLSKFAGVEISEFDEYPKVICRNCHNRLSDACKFKITVQMSDSILRQRAERRNPTTASEAGTSWPQPILLNKSQNMEIDKAIEVEVKQEILSEDDNGDENGADIDQDWEPMMDIKIEPEEISAPVPSNVQVNGVPEKLSGEIKSTEIRKSHRINNKLDAVVKEEPPSDDEMSEAAPDLPLDCMLCFKVFNTVSGLKAHVISDHSYKTVKRKAVCPSPGKSKIQVQEYICNSCDQSFKTSTDLMVHRESHAAHVCYKCDRKFGSFQQLMRHTPRCQKKHLPRDQTRPPSRPQQLLQPKALDDVTATKPTSSAIEDMAVTKHTSSAIDDVTATKSTTIDDMVATKHTSSAIDDVTATKPTKSAIDDVTATKPTSSAIDDVTATKPTSSAIDNVTATKPTCSAIDDMTATKPTSSAINDVTATESTTIYDMAATKPTSSAIDDVTATKPTSSAIGDVMATKLTSPATDDMVSATDLANSVMDDIEVSKPVSSVRGNKVASKAVIPVVEDLATTKPKSPPVEDTEAIIHQIKLKNPAIQDMVASKPQSPAIEDMIAERVQELVNTWPSTEEMDMDIEISQAQLENKLESTPQTDLVQKHQYFAVIKGQSEEKDIEKRLSAIFDEPFLSYEQKTSDTGIKSPIKITQQSVETEESCQKQTQKPETKETKIEQIQKEIQNEPFIESMEVEPMEIIQKELIPKSPAKDTGLSQTLDTFDSSENIPLVSSEVTTYNFSQTVNHNALMSQSKKVSETHQDNIHADSTKHILPKLNDSEENLKNSDVCLKESVQAETEPHILPSLLEIEQSFEHDADDIDEISEMKVHLAINPLDKDTVLLEGETKDDCGKSENCGPKLVNAGESDIQHT